MLSATLWTLGGVTLLVGVLTAVVWHQRPYPGVRWFTLAALGITWWIGAMTLGHVLDQVFGFHVAFVLLTRIEWLGIIAMAIGWFVFALAYTGRSEFGTRRVVGLLAVPPLALYPVAFANGLFVDAVGSVVGASPTLGPSFDPWLAVEPLVLAYVYALLVASSALILGFAVTSRLPHPEAAILWLLAIVVPWIVNALYVTGAIPPLGPANIDPTPFGFVALVAIGLVAIRTYDALDVAPVARAYVIDQLDTGVVVYDGDCRIVDANAWASSVLGIDAGERGQDVRAVLDTATDERLPVDRPAGTFTDRIDGRTVPVETARGRRDVTLEASIMERAYGDQLAVTDGYALVLRDETERIEREQALQTQNEQLEILNQVIRHDIRNDMQIIDGTSELLADHVDDAGQAPLQTVREKAAHVDALTRTVRDLTDTLVSNGADLQPTPLAPILRQAVTEVKASFAEATIDVGDVPDVTVRANDVLGSVFRNLLQNAIQHNDAATPTVIVRTTASSDSVVVTVADNGPGIPADRREQVFERRERGPDSEGTGLGLYLVATLVDHYGGDVWIEAADAADAAPADATGATFRVELETVEASCDCTDHRRWPTRE